MDSSEDNSENENSSNAEQEESSSEEETYNDSEENDDEDGDAENNSSQEESDDELGENEDGDVPKLAEAEFKEIPFEDLLQLQRRLGSRMYNEAIFGTSRERKVNGGSSNPAKKLKSGSKSSSSSESDDDSGPEEVTSKRKVPALGMAKNKHLTKEGPRDPRFDSKHGYFSGRQFRKNYSFINELRQKELKKLKNSLERATDLEEADKIKFVIQRTHNQIHEYKKQKALDEGRMLEKQQARQAIQEGKRPFYERKSTKQAKALVEQYDKLKETGKLAKHIDKRRKKVTGKDRKKLDFST